MLMKDARTWRWVVFVILVLFFPIVLRPWWVAVLSVIAFGLLLWRVLPEKQDFK